MLIDFCFLLILFALVYSYTNSQDQFTATASAIRQIWSGSCRLSCRHSEHSGLSGLSGLPPRASLASPDTQLTTNLAGPSRECQCESCPCALLENVLRQCRPATYLYEQVIKSIFNFITFFLRLLISAVNYMTRVLECDGDCQERQLTACNSYGDPKLSFAKSLKDIPEKIKSNTEAQNKNDLITAPAAPIQENKTELPTTPAIPKRENWVEDETAKNVGTSKETKDAIVTEPQVQKTDESPPNASTETLENLKKGFCTKCVEKGKTCISQCPRAKK